MDEESDDVHEQKGEEEEEEDVNGVPENFETEVSGSSESEEENDDMEDSSEEEKVKKKRHSKKSSAKKESVAKAKANKVATPNKSTPPTEKAPAKLSSKGPKIDDSSDTSPKTFSRKKKTDDGKEKEKASTPKQPGSKEKSGNIVFSLKICSFYKVLL